MTFLNPTLVYLLPIALLPVIIHLLNRLRYRRISWAAMEFLLASKRETVKRSRLKNLLLLAARVLALAFLVIALARPVATSGVFTSVFLGGGGTRLVIVDNSLSMSIVRSGRTNLERALECASGMAGPSSGGKVAGKDQMVPSPRRGHVKQARVFRRISGSILLFE